MKTIHRLFGIVLFFTLCCAQADESIRLYTLETDKTLAPLIIPVRSQETPLEATTRYLRNMEKSPDLMELFEGRAPDLSNATFKPLNESEKDRTLLMANAPRDYTLNSMRVESFVKRFGKTGEKTYILPIHANLGLSKTETRELFKLISDKFPLLVHLGGDDVDPSMYKKENFHARNTIPARDQFEIALIKSYTAAEKGFLFAVCRGAQITSVALGYKLIQDIPFHIRGAVPHANDTHSLHLKPTTNSILSSALAKFPSPMVNSIHHQAIIFKEGGPLELAAVGPDGITEALESKNGRILITQYHPELMNSTQGDAVLYKVISEKRKLQSIGACRQQFSFNIDP